MLGYNVLHPMGWDAFGLPAEQYAIDTGTHPSVTTRKNIDRFREQLKVRSTPVPISLLVPWAKRDPRMHAVPGLLLRLEPGSCHLRRELLQVDSGTVAL